MLPNLLQLFYLNTRFADSIEYSAIGDEIKVWEQLLIVGSEFKTL